MIETAPGDAIRAEDHNDLVRGLRTITYVEGFKSSRLTPFPHPWQCRIESGSRSGLWKVSMRRGFVNDLEATVAYQAVDDPRGWTKPENFPASRTHGGTCDRSWSERDQPPFLLLDTDRDFVTVADAARPPYFRTESAWEKDLLVASVYLYARVAGAPPRYRTWAGRMARAVTSDILGVRELAKIYVLRDGEDQQASVKQLEFWDLCAQGVQPVKLLPDAAHIPDAFAGFGLGLAAGAVAAFNATSDALTQAINLALGNIQSQTASVEWWSV